MADKYYAFISYSRENDAAAAYLHKSLERFRVPVKHVDKAYLPEGQRFLRPIFRDKRDLEVNASMFSHDIHNAIARSRYLIVLCSPAAAKSFWVNEEIKSFLETHGNDYEKIVPVILSGKPGQGGEQECLPPELQIDTITSRNLSSMIPDKGDPEKTGWENGVVQTLSYLLHVNREKIKATVDAEKLRLARINTIIGLIGTLIFACLTFWALRAERAAKLNEQLALENEAKAKANEQRAIESKILADRNAQEAREQTQRTEKTLHLLRQIFLQADPESGGKKNISLLMALDKILPQIEKERSPRLAADFGLEIGILFKHTSQYQKALALLLRAEKFYSQHAPLSEVNANTHEMLGNIYSMLRKQHLAKEHFEKALEIRLKLFGRNNINTGRTYRLLSNIYFRLSQPETAYSYAQTALDIQHGILGEENEEIAECYQVLSNAYFGLDDSDNEILYLRKALEIRKKVLGEKHYKTAECYNNIGVYYSSKEQYEEALKQHQKATAIFAEVLGMDHPKTNRSYINLGQLYLLLDQYQEALDSFHTAQKNCLALTDFKGNPMIADCWTYMGNVYRKQKKYPKMLEHYRNSLNFRLEHLGKKHVDTLQSLCLLSHLHLLRNDPKSAQIKFDKILDALNEKSSNELHWYGQRIADAYVDFAKEFLKEKNYQAAEKCFRMAKITAEKLFGENNQNTVQYALQFYHIYLHQKKNEEAEKVIRDVLQYCQKKFGEEHACVARVYLELGSLYGKLDQNEKAVEYFNKALAIWQKDKTQNAEDIMLCHYTLACYFEDKKNYAAALEEFQHAQAIMAGLKKTNYRRNFIKKRILQLEQKQKETQKATTDIPHGNTDR